MRPFLFFMLFLSAFQSIAQANLDSLWGVWNDPNHADTSRLQAMNHIALKAYKSSADSTFYFAQLAYDFAKEKELKKYMGKALRIQGMTFKENDTTNRGEVYSRLSLILKKKISAREEAMKIIDHLWEVTHNRGYYDNAIGYFSLWVKFARKEGDPRMHGQYLHNIGIVNWIKGDESKAIEFYDKAIKVLEKTNEKRGIAWALNNTGLIYRDQGEFALAMNYFQQGFKIWGEVGDQQQMMTSQINIGSIYTFQGEYEEALACLSQAMETKEELGDKVGVTASLIQIGKVYDAKGNYKKALDYYFKGAGMCEELGPEKYPLNLFLANVCIDIGNLYSELRDSTQALNYLNKALALHTKVNRKSEVALILNYIGKEFEARGDLPKAIDYWMRALDICEKNGYKRSMLFSLNQLGDYYQERGELELALEQYTRSLDLSEEIGQKEHFIWALNGIGEIYLKKRDYEKSIFYNERAFSLASEGGYIIYIRNTTESLFKCFRGMGEYRKALDMYELSITMRDSMLSKENQKAAIQQQYSYEYEKKSLKDSLQADKNKNQLEFDSQQKIQAANHNRNIILGGAAFLFILAFALWSRLRFIRKTNQVLSDKNRIIEKEKARAEASELAKNKLYTNITHEFRTPLTVINGMAEQISEPEESRRLILRNSKNLLSLVNEMLDLSKLESGKLNLHPKQGDIISYLRYLMESFDSYASAKRINLHFQTNESSLYMDYDEKKLMQIVSNLLSNAIKFSPDRSEVHFIVEIDEINEEKWLSLKVKDAGIGIPEHKLPMVFDRFYQVDDSSTRKEEGTGIGLTLTQELVKLMKGKISVESEINEGTVFTVFLPISRNVGLAVEEVKQVLPIKNLPLIIEKNSSRNDLTNDLPLVLIIEDNPDVIFYIKTCLEGLYQIKEAENGAIGIDMAVKYIPDLIISDVMMPEKDGFEVCNTLKNDERTSHIPIILLTAKADIDSRLEGLQEGADAYLAKPFEKKELLIRMEQLIELRRKLQERYKDLHGTPTITDPTFEREDSFLIKVKQFIEDNLSNDELSVEQLAQELGMSRSQLFRKLKALTGKSVILFIRSYRLARARQQLKTTQLSVSEIAYEVGFKSPAHFSTAFLKEFGVQPSSVSR